MVKHIKKHWFLYSILFSAIFHVLIFGIISLLLFMRDAYFFVTPQNLNAAEPAPLVFDFTQPKSKELAETPESARLKDAPDNAPYASDKNARAQNENAPDDLPVDNPFSKGYADAAQIENLLGVQENSQIQPEVFDKTLPEQAEASKVNETGSKISYVKQSSETFSRDMLVHNAKNTVTRQPGNSTVQHSAMDNSLSRALDSGALSFNTYDWDFAPYMLKLKRVIEEHIFPPAAFSRMGIISGRSQIKFRIERDGKLTKVDVLGYDGHISLMETSKQAIEVSIPFDKLPDNFPEKYLEVTATFNYKVYR
ncbi:MAG: hypothetical protein H6696_07510 [Deferribacteres bacterium]|nr:hypothetical protein [candidate division KSB1 bacterium]MCB9501771.1 hypothetical protein [Deferribacteres bacterium]